MYQNFILGYTCLVSKKMEIKLEDLHRHEGMPFFSLRENILLAKFRSTFSLTASMKMTRLAYIFLTAEHRVMSSFAFFPPLKEMTSGRWRTGPRRSIGNRAQWLIGYCFFNFVYKSRPRSGERMAEGHCLLTNTE